MLQAARDAEPGARLAAGSPDAAPDPRATPRVDAETVVIPMTAEDTQTRPDTGAAPASDARAEAGASEAGLPSAAGTPTAPSSGALEAAQTWRAAKLLSGGVLGAWAIGVPVGTMLAGAQATGSLSFALGYSLDTVLLAGTTAGLVLAGGYALAAGLRLEDSAERLRRAALGFAAPGGPHGAAARGEVAALNAEIDRALERLAGAERLIRAQVAAIDEAGMRIEAGAKGGAQRLETERQALLTLTEEMGREADAFAQAIEARSRAAADAGADTRVQIEKAESRLDDQVGRLEAVSARSLERFESLAHAMEGRSDALASQAEQQGETAAKIGENTAALARAQMELQAQSQRLETVIREQRRRADRVAKQITDQTARLTRLGRREPAPVRRRGSWRDILSAVERSLPGQDAAEERDAAAAMDALIERMHRFSLTLRTQLYGGPAADDLARFERGERLLFVRQLLEEDGDEVRGKIAAETQRNAVFAQAVAEFLGDFDALLEPVSGEENADEAMAEYLRSPLGRLYVMVGTATGRFGKS